MQDTEPRDDESSAAAEAGKAEAGDTTSAEAASGEAASGEAEEAPVFENRAARRARGKGGSARRQPAGKGGNVSAPGPAQARRQWGNRRTGG